MKFKCINEMEHLSFDDSQISEFKIDNEKIQFTFNGATIKAKNSQNGRYEDMYCGELILRLQNAEIDRMVKEGLKYYDADGKLVKEIPDEDVPIPAQAAALLRIGSGKVFTVVPAEVEKGYGYEFGIDVPQEQDEEEVDTFWLCITCDGTLAMWDRYCSPADA